MTITDMAARITQIQVQLGIKAAQPTSTDGSAFAGELSALTGTGTGGGDAVVASAEKSACDMPRPPATDR